MIIRNLAILAFLFALSGCAAGVRVDYRSAVPSIPVGVANEGQSIEVTVVDERPYVLNNRKGRHFVGVSRALYYNPFNITTASGLGLSTDLQSAIISSLNRGRMDASPASQSDRPSRAPRLLVLTVRDWKADAYMRVRFDYDITAEVKDSGGTVLATKSAKGSGPISNFLTAGADALNQVLADREVTHALGGSAVPLATPTATPDGSGKFSFADKSAAYDNCMRRVARVSDPGLRLAAMSMCDSAR